MGWVQDGIPAAAVWIAIDKDVLPSRAPTRRDQGRKLLTALLAVLRAVGSRERIPGADICGGYSPPRHGSWLKRGAARMDQSERHVTDRQRIDDNRHTDRELA